MQIKYLFVLAALVAVAYATSETSDLVAEESQDHAVAHSRQKRSLLLKKVLAKKALVLGGAALLGAGVYSAIKGKKTYNNYYNTPGQVLPNFGQYTQTQPAYYNQGYQGYYPTYYQQTYPNYQAQPAQGSYEYVGSVNQQLPVYKPSVYQPVNSGFGVPHSTYGPPSNEPAGSSSSFATASANSGYNY